jgi:hypothetical protein
VLRILTVKQPWASALLREKDVENRSWVTNYRGWLLVHAGKGVDLDVPKELGLTDPRSMIRGAVIGAINLTNVVDDSQSRWAESGYQHWCHDPSQAITFNTPIPWRGTLGLTVATFGLIDQLTANEPATTLDRLDLSVSRS